MPAGTVRVVETVVKANVADLQKGMRTASQEVENFGRKTEQVARQASKMTAGQGWDKLASGAGKAGLAVTAMGGMMVKSFADFDAQMSAVQASTNASAADMVKLREAAMNAGQEFGQFTSTQAAQGLEELGKAGLTTQQSIGALRGTMALAASDQMEVGKAAELTADTMNQFGLNSAKGMKTYAKEGGAAVAVANRLAQGAGAASGSAAQLGQGLSQVGAVANTMGLSMDETVQSLALFAKNGIKGSDAGTSLKTMLMSLANPSKEAAAAMKAIGFNAFDANEELLPMDQLMQRLQESTKGMSVQGKNAALATIFGSDAMRVAAVAAKEGKAGYDAMGEAMKGFGDATTIAAKKNDNLKGDLKNLGGAWENLGIQIGGAANGPLRDGVRMLNDLLGVAARNPAATQELATFAAGLAAVALGAAGLTKAVQGVQAFSSAVGAITALGKTSTAAASLDGVAGAATRLGQQEGKVSAVNRAIGALPAVAAGAAVAVAGIEIARVFNAQNTANIDKTRTSIEQLTGAAKAAASGSTDFGTAVNSTFKGTGVVFDGVTGALIDMQTALSNPNFDKLGSGAMRLVGMKSETDSVRESFQKLDQTLSTLDAGTAAVSMQQVSAANAKVGLTTQQLIGLFPQYTAKLREQAASMGVMNVSAQEYEAWMGGRLPASVRAAAQAAVRMGGANAAAAKQILQTADAAAKMSAKVNAMPDKKTLAVIVNAANAQTTVDGFVAKLKGLPPKTVSELKAIAQTQGLDVAKKKLAEIRDKTVTAKTKADTSGAKTTQAAVNALKGKTVTAGTKADLKGKNTTQASINSLKGKTVTTGTKADVRGKNTTQAAVNSLKGKTVTTGTKADVSGQRATQAAVNSTKGKSVTVKTVADTSGARSAQAAVNSVVGKTVNVVTNFIKRITNAEGGVYPAVEQYANGGTRERHVAQIAPAGAWRVWAEDETGGEAYIPLAPAKRPRSMAILEQVAAMFGKQVVPNAVGSLYSQTVAGAYRGVVAPVAPLGELTAAVNAMTKATTALTAAAKANRVPAVTKRNADARYTQAVAAKNALTARQKVEDISYSQAILNARKKTGGSLYASLVAEQAKRDAALDKRIAAAQKARSTTLVRNLQASKKTMDAEYKIRKATASIAAKQGAAAVAALTRAKQQNDLNQQRQMVAMTARVTVAQKAKTIADQRAAVALTKLKATTEAQKDAAQALADKQRQITDNAKQASEQAQSGFRAGDTLAEYMANMHRGALAEYEMNAAMARLGRAGLSKQVQDDLWAKGVENGGRIAQQLLAGGMTAIRSANGASASLDRFGDAIGWRQATGITLNGSINPVALAQLRATVQADTRAQQLSMTAETRKLAELLAQYTPVQVYGADPNVVAAKVEARKQDALARTGLR